MVVVDCLSNFAVFGALCDGRVLLLGYDFSLGEEGLLGRSLLLGQFASLLPRPLLSETFVVVWGVGGVLAPLRLCPPLACVLLIGLGGCCECKRRIWVWAGWNGVRAGLHWHDVAAISLCCCGFAAL